MCKCLNFIYVLCNQFFVILKVIYHVIRVIS
jgi:hypothetical protein